MNRTKSEQKPPNPFSSANILSRIFFWWLNDLFKTGLKRTLEENDMYRVRKCLNSKTLTDKFSRYWDAELQKDKSSVIRFLFKIYGFNILGWGFVYALGLGLMRVVQPLCLGKLVSYFSPDQQDISKNDAYLYAAGIVITALWPVVSIHSFFLYSFQVGAKIRIGCAGLLYRKVLKLPKESINEGLNGKIINILSNDLVRFELALSFIHDLWRGPMEATAITYLIYREIGYAGFIGMGFLLSFVPLQIWIGKKAGQFRLSAAKRTDVRVKIMNEIISGIQVIKMYTWEKSFAVMVDKIRKREIHAVRRSSYIRAILVSFGIIARFSIFLSLVSYIYFGNVITASKVYMVSSFFNMLNFSMVYLWPVGLATVSEGIIAAKRVEEFLMISEEKPNILKNTCEKIVKEFCEKDAENKISDNNTTIKDSRNPLRRISNSGLSNGIKMENATATWKISENPVIGISSINLKIEPNELCAIVGQVGSGKTTLLQVILGELELDEGLITINGKLSYAAQEPWLFEGSIKSNIIFVEDFDETRYKEVVRVCALDKDFRLLPNGDVTIVGERGISLSGGQKARVNLARAIYKNADIYLLDDPLSAVDTHVGKHIFNECVRVFLQDKICVLVTHQLQYLKDVKHLVLMNEGKIEGQGTYEDLQKISGDSFLSIEPVSNEKNEKEERRRKSEEQKPIAAKPVTSLEDEVKIRQETQTAGSVSLNVYTSFFKSVESKLYLVILAGFFLFAQFGISGVDYFISQWVNWEENAAATDEPSKPNVTESNETSNNDITRQREIFVITYSVLILIATYLYVHRTFTFFNMCLRASIKLHDRIFRGITRAKMYFFNTNPSGRILNRLSRDINCIDSLLPLSLMDALAFFLEFAAVLILISIANVWLLIPTVILIILLYGIRFVYIKTGRCVKRIDSITRSPVYSHTNATLQGLTSVRVFKAEYILENEFHEHMDHNTSAWFLSIATTRAFGLWLDLICCLYIAVVAFSFLLVDTGISSGNVGLAILQSISLTGMCQRGMRQTAEVETQMTSVERVLEYADLPSEAPLQSTPKYQPSKGWPGFGKITFNDLSFRYSTNTDFVLKNLNLQINPKEKIGIVGRTGAGKSSLIQALFRLADLDGSIFIDEIEINSLGLHDLRSKISIIPQDPVLFSGTLRFNLDPFDEKRDEELWSALTQVELKPFILSFPGGLECKMSDGGSNFSMGQRQLVCLARAILRNNKILILDEATANVDPETDKLIQTTIRNQFSDCTVLTIAHRLHTVMDSDRVLVIEAGQAVEFDHPHNLLQMNSGYFRQLVDQTGSETAAALMHLAIKDYNQKHGI